jgi:hypothetical protein
VLPSGSRGFNVSSGLPVAERADEGPASALSRTTPVPAQSRAMMLRLPLVAGTQASPGTRRTVSEKDEDQARRHAIGAPSCIRG